MNSGVETEIDEHSPDVDGVELMRVMGRAKSLFSCGSVEVSSTQMSFLGVGVNTFFFFATLPYILGLE